MSQLIPSEGELHAYVDECLDPERRRAVELYLAANPEQAMRVDGWRRDARQLRAALSGLAGQPANPRLDPAYIRGERRRRQQRRWANTAVLLLALGMGGLGGWHMRDASLVASNLPMADALQAHRLFADAGTLDLSARDQSTDTHAHLCSHIYSLFTSRTASKAITAQYLVDLLEDCLQRQVLSREQIMGWLPGYLTEAITYVTTRLELTQEPSGD